MGLVEAEAVQGKIEIAAKHKKTRPRQLQIASSDRFSCCCSSSPFAVFLFSWWSELCEVDGGALPPVN